MRPRHFGFNPEQQTFAVQLEKSAKCHEQTTLTKIDYPCFLNRQPNPIGP